MSHSLPTAHIVGSVPSPAHLVARASEAIADAAYLLAGAADVDWASDVAALYRARLDDLGRLVAAVDQRADEVAIAVGRWGDCA